MRAKDQCTKKGTASCKLEMTRENLHQLQEMDETLRDLRDLAEKEAEKDEARVYWKEGLLYYRTKQGEKGTDRIVLPRECRREVMELAHSVPTAGHLGRKETAARVS